MATRDARAALQAIHALMDGTEWSADTLQNIAEVLTVPTGNPDAPTAPVFKVWNQVSAVVTGRKEN